MAISPPPGNHLFQGFTAGKIEQTNSFYRSTVKLFHHKQIPEEGFILPLVITVGLIMLAGSAAMLTRSFGGLVGSTRLEQSRQAKAIVRDGFGAHDRRLESKL